MRILKLLIISLIILSFLVTAISLLFPSKVIVSRAIEVKSSAEKIEYYASDLNHWRYWMSDWKQNEVSIIKDTALIGTQKIYLVNKTDSVVNFHWIATGQAAYQVKIEWFALEQGSYVIHWTFVQEVSWYPWEKFQTLLNEKVIGSKMELELQNLQDVIHQSAQ